MGALWMSAWLSAQLMHRRERRAPAPDTLRRRVMTRSVQALSHAAAWSIGWGWVTAMWAEEETAVD